MKTRLLAVLLIVTFTGVGQATEIPDSYIELLRSDLRAGKQELVEYAMDLQAEDADAFWVLYKEYETSRIELADRTLELIGNFSEAYAMTGPTTVRALSADWLAVQDERNKLNKKYYKKAEKQFAPRVAARWMQIEHRIRLLVDLQIASEVPLIDRVPR
jgi:hypothetical protein